MLVSFGLLLVLAVASYVLALLGFLGIGVILDDHYVFASKEKRAQMDRKAYQLQSAIIFLCLGTMFLLNLIRLLTGIRFFTYAAYGVCAGAVVYTIVSHYVIKRRGS